MSTERTTLQIVAQRNGSGPRVPRSRPMSPDHEAVAAVATDLILHGTAGPCLGIHRGHALTEASERSAALAQCSYIASHRGTAA